MSKKHTNDFKLYSRLFSYAGPYKDQFVIAIFIMLFSVGCDAVLPFFTSEMIRMIGQTTDFDMTRFMAVVWIEAGLLLLWIIFAYSYNHIIHHTTQKVMFSLREEVFMKIEYFSTSQLNKVPNGKLVTRVTNDTNSINRFFSQGLIGIIKSIFQLILVTVMMFTINYILTLIVLGIGVLVAATSYIFRLNSRKAYAEVKSHLSNMNGFLAENISGMKITQAYNQEEKQLAIFDETNKGLRKAQTKELLVHAFFRSVIYMFYGLLITIVIYVGSRSFLNGGDLDYAVIYAFYMYVDRFFNPVQQIAERFNLIQSALASSERIFDIIDTKPEILEADDAIDLTNFQGKIEFRHVDFSYIEGLKILDDVSFVINPGQTLALVGATGSGKTTILNLIVRNYDIDAGQILIDDVDIKRYKLASLRSQIGQMLQDVFLFNGTVKDNITLFEDIDLEKVKEACEFVNAKHFIERLPNQYDEIIKERGNNFSSGERQLISFSRCILTKPKVMILDEATANIDTETEALIQDSLKKMQEIGTMIIVAHRLSTIQNADQILVMKKGKIIERGTHQELLSLNGHYYDLYQLQYQSKR